MIFPLNDGHLDLTLKNAGEILTGLNDMKVFNYSPSSESLENEQHHGHEQANGGGWDETMPL